MTSVELLARVGTFLRATSLDEMPRILHVLRDEPPSWDPVRRHRGGTDRPGVAW